MTFLYEVYGLIPENIKTKSLLKTNYNKMRVISLGNNSNKLNNTPFDASKLVYSFFFIYGFLLQANIYNIHI